VPIPTPATGPLCTPHSPCPQHPNLLSGLAQTNHGLDYHRPLLHLRRIPPHHPHILRPLLDAHAQECADAGLHRPRARLCRLPPPMRRVRLHLRRGPEVIWEGSIVTVFDGKGVLFHNVAIYRRVFRYCGGGGILEHERGCDGMQSPVVSYPASLVQWRNSMANSSPSLATENLTSY
jgi:hypothetical protein